MFSLAQRSLALSRFLFAGLAVAGVLCAGAVCAAAAKPNFVVMLTDDQRWDALGVVQRELGRRAVPWLATATPNMDRLAAEGFRFRNAFVVNSLCSPSRAAFLTGLYNHLNGVANNHTPFPRATDLRDALRAAGYRTGYFGKWHMGDQRERPGFDEYASFVGQGRYDDAVPGERGHGADRGWVDDVSTDYAVDSCGARPPPFALVLGFKSPHAPCDPPAAARGPVSRRPRHADRNATSYAPYDPTPVPPARWPSDVRNYFRTIVGVDQNVGRVLAALEAAGVARTPSSCSPATTACSSASTGADRARRPEQARRVRGIGPDTAADPLPARSGAAPW